MPRPPKWPRRTRNGNGYSQRTGFWRKVAAGFTDECSRLPLCATADRPAGSLQQPGQDPGRYPAPEYDYHVPEGAAPAQSRADPATPGPGGDSPMTPLRSLAALMSANSVAVAHQPAGCACNPSSFVQIARTLLKHRQQRGRLGNPDSSAPVTGRRGPAEIAVVRPAAMDPDRGLIGRLDIVAGDPDVFLSTPMSLASTAQTCATIIQQRCRNLTARDEIRQLLSASAIATMDELSNRRFAECNNRRYGKPPLVCHGESYPPPSRESPVSPNHRELV
jgi:hypothetical protein